MDFKEELEKRGAREFQIVAMSSDEERAMAAIVEAERRGVEHVIPYALTLFDDPEWTPKSRTRSLATNVHALDRACTHCGGDRFVLVGEPDPLIAYSEQYAPCEKCNPNADTSFWRTDGTLVRTRPR